MLAPPVFLHYINHMELIHTSPNEITSINSNGRFGEFLFFSAHEYAMAAGEVVAYTIEIDESDVIDAGSLFFHDDASTLEGLVEELAGHLSTDRDTAQNLIDESVSVYDIDSIDAEDAADASWDVQLFTARAAKALGFRGVRVRDEQGAAYMIDMLGRETDLRKA